MQHPIRFYLAACAALLFAGCGAPPQGASNGIGGFVQSSGASQPAKKGSLLYVSSVLTGDVYVYSYATQQLVQTLTGFTQPYGLCADKAGDVFIVNDGASEILEYAHGGSNPIATLADPNEYPEGCSIDPTTGNLAVTNFYSTTGSGSVSVYAKAQGSPQMYSDPSMTNYRFCGYDSHGNLYVDGVNGSSAFVFAELPKGKTSFKNIAFAHPIGWPGGVQWDGKYIAVGDTDTGTIYRTNGTKGAVKGTTQLGNANYVNQFWIEKGTLVAPSQDGNAAGYYDYPAGGAPVTTISVQEPFGAVVSK
jgi:hypothetical protein